ncbi:hypothetical protein GLYMA_04G169200v4 [Glycine max]|uniref:Protein EMBRYO DEFECTIVE 514 n=1 Tax=Glycine max TaxID=3847 RepID=I1JWU6_SOYBN|nr:protein EMBRYO DEFECTIVE 514 [Glycine max]KAH1254720.1 Protein EMBRYO DEFECTIVE 514 [Glycine max]KRH63337.1 hypothetical protein GLYMA_04G169200v4 [Glycine max]|eukprot:XP_003523019.1 protein EMBRYO DEFECTIVE 514 [Glycine max]
MAEEAALEVVDPNTAAAAAAVDMDVENVEAGGNGAEPNQKRAREEEEPQGGDDDVSKKQRVDEENEKSVEEQRLEKRDEQEEEKGEEKEAEKEEEEEKEASGSVNLGFKSFGSSLEMFHYFYNFLHTWPQYLNVNKYEHLMLLELLKNGHAEPDKKIGGGVRAFQVRKHPTFKSRCFFLIREDDSADDFSFRKCVDHILPLPEEMHLKSDANKALGGGGGKHYGGGKGGRGGRGGRGRGGRGGHGRGGKWRN